MFAAVESSDQRRLRARVRADRHEGGDARRSRAASRPRRRRAPSTGARRGWSSREEPVARHRRRHVRHRAPALPPRRARRPPGARLRRPDDVRPGLAGLAVSLALLVAWADRRRARDRPAPARRRRRVRWTPERVGLAALAATAVASACSRLIDWTWFVPGPAVIALAAAGFVAGLGALRARLAGRAEAACRCPGPGSRPRPRCSSPSASAPGRRGSRSARTTRPGRPTT